MSLAPRLAPRLAPEGPDEIILAIESSCDETAMAAVDGFGRVHFERLFSQIEIHKKYKLQTRHTHNNK